MRLKFVLLVGFLLCLHIVAAYGIDRSMHILAVGGEGDEKQGSIADLDVEIIPGQGRVFIQTYPLSGIDLQVSTRIAKEIACSRVEVNCERYDFIYTIHTDGSIIRGGSAGAAITALTIAALNNWPIDNQVTATGTIGAGGLVGNVGGIQEKIEAAAEKGLYTVLIPAGKRFQEQRNASEVDIFNNTNTSQQIDLVAYGEELGVQVKEVFVVDDVVEELTGRRLASQSIVFEVPPYYDTTMDGLARDLCQRTPAEQKDALKVAKKAQKFLEVENSSFNVTVMLDRGEELYELSWNASSYSAASYCFGANLQFTRVHMYAQENTNQIYVELNNTLANYTLPEIVSVTDLQALMLVEERLNEAKEYLESASEVNDSVEFATLVAYAQERYKSAVSWSSFIGQEQGDFFYDTNALYNGCALRLQEAQERRLNLLQFIPEQTLQDIDLDRAFDVQKDKNYALCIYYASKAKAYFDLLASGLGGDEEQLQGHFINVQNVALSQISQQWKNDVFPIAAYSYIQYGESLAETGDIYSALLYAHYAIELADIDIYLEGPRRSGSIPFGNVNYLIAGLALGLLFTLVALRIEDKRKE
jgi:predicted S18 family serine protease